MNPFFGELVLQTWLVNEYNDEDAEADDWQRIKFCAACKAIVTVGRRCAELECNIRLHDICQEAYFRSKPEKKCPKCETLWDGNVLDEGGAVDLLEL